MNSVYVVVEQEHGEVYTSVFMSRDAAIAAAREATGHVEVRETRVDVACNYFNLNLSVI